MTRLAILIPTLTDRAKLLNRLLAELDKQRKGKDVIVIINEDQKQKTTGQKRNELIAEAVEQGAEYVAFVDDDDEIGPTYIQRGIEVPESGMDCGELWGNYYERGKLIKPFHHYLGCTHAWDDAQKYHRPPNHLNFMKLALVKDFTFQNKVFGEDMTWAMEIRNAGVFNTMYKIDDILYHYHK
jgi:glycosyltransferase involved in cell wall biosynthesis